jgi:hypothetical protein
MMSEQVRSAYSAEPFQSFVMHLADGRSIPVHHREFMASAPNSRTAVVYQPDGSFNIVDLLLVTDLEFKPLPPRNGKRRGKPGRG